MLEFRYILFSLAVMMAAVSTAADDVVARIGGEPVSKAEFERFCKMVALKTSRHPLSVSKCMDRFVALRLKALAARQAGYNKRPQFVQECKALQGQAIKPLMLDAGKEDSLCRNLYRQSQSRLLMNDWVKIEQITIPFSQRASGREENRAVQRMDSVYKALCNGADFKVLGGQAEGWYPMVGLLEEYAAQLKHLDNGEFSRPFTSPKGVHIVRLIDRKRNLSYEEARPYLLDYVENSDLIKTVLNKNLYKDWCNGNPSHDSEINSLKAEVENRLLAKCWDEFSGNAGSAVVPYDLERYFEAHRDEYDWEYPHYKGAVIRCDSKRTGKKLKKLLKREAPGRWNELVSVYLKENPDAAVEWEAGLFQIGSNPYVDKLAFKCGTMPVDDRVPYVFLLGKRLKKGPETYKDVVDEVEKDYLESLENNQVEALKRQFRVEINQDVLKTVNCSGNN